MSHLVYHCLPDGAKPEKMNGSFLQSGKPVTADDLDGRIVLIDFWFIGCKGCMEAIPYLVSLRQHYPADKVLIAGLNVSDNNVEGLKEFVRKHRINYEVIMGKPDLLPKYSVSVFPSIYILDASGKVIHSEMGFEEKGFEERISKVIDAHL